DVPLGLRATLRPDLPPARGQVAGPGDHTRGATASLRAPVRHQGPRLASRARRLGHGHDLEQVAVGILEVESAAPAAAVDLPVGVVVGLAPVGDALGLDPAEDRVELGLPDVESVVQAPADPPAHAPVLRPVGKVHGQALVDLYLSEVAAAGRDRKSKDL